MDGTGKLGPAVHGLRAGAGMRKENGQKASRLAVPGADMGGMRGEVDQARRENAYGVIGR